MKLNKTFVVFDAGGLSQTKDWQTAHATIETAVNGISWPPGTSNGLVIPRIVSIKKGAEYTDKTGKIKIWTKKKAYTLRNGVVPLRQMFRKNLEDAGWYSEEPSV